MPNWVKHTVTVKGDAAALAAFRAAVQFTEPGDAEPRAFSFKSVLPMPEELNIEESSDGDLGLAALTGERLSSVLSYGLVHQAGLKTQQELQDWLKANRPEALELGQKYVDNLAKYGCKTWYGWANEHWKTKWDACDVNLTVLEDGSLQYYFETAWSFPEPVFQKLAEQFPNVLIDGVVDEEGGWFYGEFVCKEGQLIIDFKKGVRAGGPYDYGDEDEDDEGDDESDD